MFWWVQTGATLGARGVLGPILALPHLAHSALAPHIPLARPLSPSPVSRPDPLPPCAVSNSRSASEVKFSTANHRTAVLAVVLASRLYRSVRSLCWTSRPPPLADAIESSSGEGFAVLGRAGLPAFSHGCGIGGFSAEGQCRQRGWRGRPARGARRVVAEEEDGVVAGGRRRCTALVVHSAASSTHLPLPVRRSLPPLLPVAEPPRHFVALIPHARLPGQIRNPTSRSTMSPSSVYCSVLDYSCWLR